MKLSRVEIQGFKSFAQRTELSFDSGITGIVGPNGSGKSNIADAVRWVLGEQSAKILRGAKMEDVIFNGTQTRKPLPYCEVSLQFDNEDKALNSPYSEVLVTRRVYRSGEGEYFLNRVNCRLRDVLELFRDTGIGKEGYSIIGQGRIEEILSTKGDERRQVFEEAAGIVTFRVRKEEAERKLSRTRENLLRVNDLIEEISARLGPLEEQSKTAQEYLALSTRQKYLDINVYLIRHDRLQARLSSLRELTQGLQESIQGHEEQMEALGQQRAELERRHGDAVFLGYKHGEDLARHVASADVFVFPSLTDTFGLVMLEALACGVPVAAFPVQGPRDVILSDKVGCLDDDLAVAVTRALTLSREDCRKYALGYTWDQCARLFESHLAPISRRPSDGDAPA